MGFLDFWKKLISKKRESDTIRGSSRNAIFTSFGRDIYDSDIVRTAIHRVCEEVSKCKIKSVIEKQNPRKVEIQDDSINAVFNGRVNELCNLKDFLYKVAWLTVVNKNCFIYWLYDEEPLQNGYVKRVTRGFYPLQNVDVRIYRTDYGELRIELTSQKNGAVFDLPYSDIIHVRQEFGQNEYMGGDETGNGGFYGVMRNLQTIHVMKEAVPKSLKASLGMKGVLAMRGVPDIDKKKVSREELEKHLFESENGIIVTDYEADFSPLNISATDIPTNILSFIRDEILAPFGVSMPILLGKYTDDEYTAFYQTAVEGILIAITEAMKVTLFTPRQLAYGETIKYYDKLVQSLSFARRVEICEMTKDDGLLNRSERRELLGYEPDEQPTRVSLNYIDINIANDYQVGIIGNKKE